MLAFGATGGSGMSDGSRLVRLFSSSFVFGVATSRAAAPPTGGDPRTSISASASLYPVNFRSLCPRRIGRAARTWSV
eukprot:2734475-Rhodomonas_salina.1